MNTILIVGGVLSVLLAFAAVWVDDGPDGFSST
jgi:hypothetical protein